MIIYYVYHYIQATLSDTGTIHDIDTFKCNEFLKRDGDKFKTIQVRKGGGLKLINYGSGKASSFTKNNGSIYIVPTVYQLTFKGLQIGSDVVLLEAGTNNVIDSVDEVTDTSWNYIYSTPTDFDYGIIKAGYITIYRYGLTMADIDSEISIAQIIDRNYV